VLSLSSQNIRRTYAISISTDDPSHRASKKDPRPTPRFPGHPEDLSRIVVDTTAHGSPDVTPEVEKVDKSGTVNAGARIYSLDEAAPPELPKIPVQDRSSQSEQTPSVEPKGPNRNEVPFRHRKQLTDHWRRLHRESRRGTKLSQTYDPLTILKQPPTADELTLPLLLANQTHLGHATSLWNPANSSYIFGIRDGIHIISLDITYAYLRRAARVVKEVARRGGIILFVGTRKGQEEIVVNSAALARGYHIFDRWTPGSLTNGQQILGDCAVKVVDMFDRDIPQYDSALSQGQHTVMRPDLVICLNPLENEVCLHECGLYNVPTIGVIDTDANPSRVTYPIPANDDSHRSIALIAGVLGQAGKEGQRLRLAAAERGEVPYSRRHVQDVLRGLEEISTMDVQDNSGGALEK